ncbi:membrane lipoprotein lipid attachment site-containing protein [Pluralibacter sp.]|uniref:membrane lipoprotein lipid attachment site-containing protein n=1 Tax=Pluralibacter sp. TaxID=1920032 RepID=UPI0025CF6197|nr:membrane lipoprotein lipid attachment site-containing protein [Pluralibacter sp.]
MMKKVICAVVALAALSGCTNSPAHRIAECQKNGGTRDDCVAAEWEYEKAHPLPKYDASNYDNAAVLQAAFNANAARSKSTAQ